MIDPDGEVAFARLYSLCTRIADELDKRKSGSGDPTRQRAESARQKYRSYLATNRNEELGAAIQELTSLLRELQ